MKRLTEITVEGFRIFREPQTVNLDANVVLIHGTNGCGKTSLLHALELNLTGGIQDLDAFGDSYPKCLRHFDITGAASVGLNYVDDNGARREHVIHVQPDAKVQPGGVLSRPERQHFLDRCYLSQARLARLLEIYQAVDKEKKESPLATFVRELLGLDVLENLTGGLQVIGDKRRVRNKIKSYADLEEKEKHLLAQEEQLQSQIRENLEALSQDGLKGDSNILAVSDTDDGVRKLSEDELNSELTKLRVEVSVVDQVTAVLASLVANSPSISTMNLEAEIEERDSIQSGLSKLLREHLAEAVAFLNTIPAVGSAESDESVITDLWDRSRKGVERRIVELRETIRSCVKSEEDLTAARARADDLDQQWVILSETISTEQTPDRAFGETLRLMIDHVDGQLCPVCDRDYRELNRGSLRNHLQGKLTELEKRHSLLAEVLSLQAKRDEQRKVVAGLESKEADTRRTRLDTENFLQTGLLLQKGFEEFASSRESWVANNRKQQIVKSDVVKAKNADSQRQVELKRLEEIAQRSMSSQTYPPLASAEYPLKLRSDLQIKLTMLQEIQAKEISAKRSLENVNKLRVSLEQCKKQREACKRAQERADRLIESARLVAKKANDQKRQIIERVFDQTMNGLWRDLFERLVLSESFYPQLSPPEISRNRVETRLSAARGGGLAFPDLAAVLSSGNLNTAALSLFLALNLIEKPRHQMLLLDDPVQNMDDIHVVNLGTLLKAVVLQANRQLIIAVHERSLFDYLRIELGPSREGESLIAVEMQRLPEGESASLSWTKIDWQPDRVSFSAKATG